MSAASPTPLGAGSHFTSLGRRTSARQALRRPVSRPQFNRSESQPSVPSAREIAASAIEGAKSQPQQYDAMHDSSDEEIPVPMKLSALTKALLNDGGASDVQHYAQPEPRIMTRRRSYLARSGSAAVEETRRHVRAGSASVPSARPSSPARARDSSPAPRKRIVRLSTTPGGGPVSGGGGGLRRSLSASNRRRPESRGPEDEPVQQTGPPAPLEEAADINTPAQPARRVQIATGSSAQRQRSTGGSSGVGPRLSGSAFRSEHEVAPEEPRTESRPQSALNQSSISKFGGSVRAREDQNAQGSMRVKRLGKVPGSFLSGPARRGRRRESEEDRLAREFGDGEMPETQMHEEVQMEAEPAPPSYRDFAASGSPVSSKELRAAGSRRQSYADLRAASRMEAQRDEFDTAHEEPVQPRPEVPSAHDQENEMPSASAFQRRKASFSVLDRDQEKKLLRSPSLIEIGSRPVPRAVSPERPILATISQNLLKTPHVVIPMQQRPAPPPPPPKMSVLDTATATAGAATTSQANKKKSVILKVNGRSYQRVDCIGRGGSAKVYRVTAENSKMFALKRVNIENADENTVKGFKGEISLLQKLSNVERVIQLYDFELNEEKHILSLLMEMGELDLNTLLRVRQNPEGSKLDPVFIRFYWKEMLECLAAVHAHDIVHSDLKPANFVVVQGRLKLIDFGIANAIQTDETVNVHRETQIGTPNYMSPESLMDSNHYAFTSAHGGRSLQPGSRGPKLMKLGKPSDVWSLGCILYQMVYGNPPFGHIQNQMARCQAIINWNHKVEFPERGLGGIRVPPSLLRTMRRCLNREQHSRPTCAELLSENDPFLYPMEYAVDIPGMEDSLPVTEELLGRIIQSVVTRCRERLPTEGEAVSAWPAAYWTSVKKAIAAK
ncbi:kinase-like protein, partial [Cryphonectria parasitica EP155]